MSIVSLLGYGFMGVDNHICAELLRAGQIDDEVNEGEDGLLEVRGFYSPPNGSYRRRVSVFADPEQQFFPVKFQIWFDQTGTLDSDILTSQLWAKNGVLVPLAGAIQQFSIMEELPDGLTSGEVNAMPKALADEVTKRTVYKAVPFEEPVLISHLESTIDVNDIKPIAFYQLEIPAGARHRDFSNLEQVSIQKPIIAQAPFPSGPDNSNLIDPLYTLLVLNGGLLLGWLGWKRFGRRRMQ